MTESDEKQSRLRWVTLGEAVAVAALILSALGLWNSWRSGQDKPAPERVVEERPRVPLALRGLAGDDGRVIVISAVDPGHALDSLTVRIAGFGKSVSLGSDGQLRSRDVQQALGEKRRAATISSACRSASTRVMSRPARIGAAVAITCSPIAGRTAV